MEEVPATYRQAGGNFATRLLFCPLHQACGNVFAADTTPCGTNLPFTPGLVSASFPLTRGLAAKNCHAHKALWQLICPFLKALRQLICNLHRNLLLNLSRGFAAVAKRSRQLAPFCQGCATPALEGNHAMGSNQHEKGIPMSTPSMFANM